MLLFSCLLLSLWSQPAALVSLGPVAPASRPVASPRHIAVTLNGRVLNNKGVPLPGAIVLVKGTASAATTNSVGEFLLTSTEEAPVLEFSCLGYQTRAVPTQDLTPVNVTLYPLGTLVPLDDRENTADPVSSPVLVTADVLPAFPGGDKAYRSFMLQNAKYPEEAKKLKLAGTVYVSFVVDETGHIQNTQILKGIGRSLDEEALRLVRTMPWWTPGLVAGKPVRVASTLRISFGLIEQQ